MKIKLLILISVLLGTFNTANAQYQQNSLRAYEMGKLPGKVYMFGFSQEMGDTVAYITDVMEVDSIMLQKKTKFLPFRYEFGMQLKEYLEGKKGLKLQTSSVFYSAKKATVEKKLAKMRKRYLSIDHSTVVNIKPEEFKFKHPLDK